MHAAKSNATGKRGKASSMNAQEEDAMPLLSRAEEEEEDAEAGEAEEEQSSPPIPSYDAAVGREGAESGAR